MVEGSKYGSAARGLVIDVEFWERVVLDPLEEFMRSIANNNTITT